MRELSALTERVASAKVWGEQAEEAVEQWRDEGAEQTFTELLLDHERFGLELPAAAYVRACLAALEWEFEARAALSVTSTSAGGSASGGASDKDARDKEKPSTSNGGCDGGDGGAKGDGGKAGGATPPPPLGVLEDLGARARELEDLEEGLEEEVARRLEAVEEWSGRVDDALRGGGGAAGGAKTKYAAAAAAAAAATAERRPTPEAIRALIEVGDAT